MWFIIFVIYVWIEYVPGRFLVTNIKSQNSAMYVISACLPEIRESSPEKDKFYKDLQDTFSRINDKKRLSWREM